MRSVARHPRRATRDEVVDAQYENADAATGYAASYEGAGPAARYYHSRLHVVDEALGTGRGGDLLDVGCGPGMLVRHLLDTRPGDFRISACDRSGAMIGAARQRVDPGEARLDVARIEDMPYPADSFDVVVAMGVLEYADAEQGLREVVRVLRPGGLFVVSMLNPYSHYRLYQWAAYWPLLRLLGRVEGLAGRPPERRHGAPHSGIRAIGRGRLCRLLHRYGLVPRDSVYYDLTVLVPPIDKVVRPRTTGRWRTRPETTVSRGARRLLGTGYLVSAHHVAVVVPAARTRSGADRARTVGRR